MAWPKPVDALWRDLESVRAELLRELEGVSQRQAEWRPAPGDWSIGEVIEAAPAAFSADLAEFAPLPVPVSEAANAPESVWPAHGKPLAEQLATLKAVRERSRQSFDRLAACGPRALRFKHFRLGELDLAQWWRLAVDHDRTHLGQARDVKRATGFPAA